MKNVALQSQKSRTNEQDRRWDRKCRRAGENFCMHALEKGASDRTHYPGILLVVHLAVSEAAVGASSRQ